MLAQSAENGLYVFSSGISEPLRQSVTFFEASPGGRDVVQKFVKTDLKRQPEIQAQLIDQIRILQNTPLQVLRETEKVEYIRDGIFSLRYKARISGNIWIRLLFACFPTDNEIVILLPILKKQNKLAPQDLDQAKTNLRILKERAQS
jgi:phage-related protein